MLNKISTVSQQYLNITNRQVKDLYFHENVYHSLGDLRCIKETPQTIYTNLVQTRAKDHSPIIKKSTHFHLHALHIEHSWSLTAIDNIAWRWNTT